MAKKKDSAAMFEVISKSREKRSEEGLAVPSWMGRPVSQGEPAAPSEPAPEAAPSAPLEMPAVEPVGAVPQAVSTTGGRLQLSLNYVSCMVIFLAVVLMLAAAFWLGRASAPGGKPGQVGQTGKNAAERPAIKREAGKYYLVIQDLKAEDQQKLEAARDIVAFCNANGYPAEVRSTTEGKLIVWSFTPLEKDDVSDPAVRAFVDEVEALGRKYMAGGGQYNFMQRRRSGGELTPMFIKYVE